MSSLEELADSLVGEGRADRGLVRAATELARLWREAEHLRYITHDAAEKNLRELVNQYLGAFFQ